MYVETRVVLGASQTVLVLPASAISYAPYGDSVFVVEDVKGPDGKTFRGVRQQFVKLGGSRGDQVAVLSGLKPGEEIVTSGVFKLRNGAAVQVNNQIQPANSADAEAGGQLDEADRSLHPPAGAGHRGQPGDPDRRPASRSAR